MSKYQALIYPKLLKCEYLADPLYYHYLLPYFTEARKSMLILNLLSMCNYFFKHWHWPQHHENVVTSLNTNSKSRREMRAVFFNYQNFFFIFAIKSFLELIDSLEICQLHSIIFLKIILHSKIFWDHIFKKQTNTAIFFGIN